MSGRTDPWLVLNGTINQIVGLPIATRTAAEQVVLSAAHARFTPDQRHAFVSLCHAQQLAAWPNIFQVAGSHHLRSLLWAHMAQEQLALLVEPAIWEVERHYYQQQLLQQMRLRHSLKAAATTLQAAGIRVMPFKGPMLCQRLYGQLGPRPSQDLDLLIDVRANPPAIFRLLQPLFSEWQQRDIHVELAWSLIHRLAYQAAFASRAIWSRSREMTIGGTPYHQMHPYDEVRYLCVHHVVQHGASLWMWLVDIAEILQGQVSQASWHWDDFIAEVIATETALPVLLTLLQMRHLLDSSIPSDGVFAQLAQAAVRRREQLRWHARDTRLSSMHDVLALTRLVQTPRDARRLLRAIVWPDLPYLQEYHHWQPGQSPTLARLQNLMHMK